MALFELGDFFAKLISVAALHVGLTAYLLMLALGQWGFADQRSKPGVVGFTLDLDDGLLGDG